MLVVQPGVADPTRAPAGQHTLWAYCHVPNGSTLDRTDAIENQLERFAPGFRDLVLARATRTAAEYEAYNANYVGGDINGGRAGLYQAVIGPVPQWSPLPHAAAGRLPVLVLHAAGRRRARHVRRAWPRARPCRGSWPIGLVVPA